MIIDKALISIQLSRTFAFCFFPGCQKETLLIAILSPVSVNRLKIQSVVFFLVFCYFLNFLKALEICGYNNARKSKHYLS